MDVNRIQVSNPKRPSAGAKGRSGWYPYYAGFSVDFASKILSTSDLSSSAKVLDPWNGSGTTTASAAALGVSCVGVDLNPVMMFVARARLLGKRAAPSLIPLGKAICHTRPVSESLDLADPLTFWFSRDTTVSLRSLEWGIQQILCGYQSPVLFSKWEAGTLFSDLTAFYYLALFRTVKALLKSFSTSNPTWIKVPVDPSKRVHLSSEDLKHRFIFEVTEMASAMTEDPFDRDSRIELTVGSSSKLPLPDSSVDMVLASPPYCTRIDYAIATLPELAILGFSSDSYLPNLRNNLIGTPTISATVPPIQDSWGITCRNFLDESKAHRSKASGTYYWKNHCQYFDGVYRSISEIGRVLKAQGMCILVVQDSWYKDIRNDVPQIVTEMAQHLCFALRRREDFTSNRNMVRVNTVSRAYRRVSDATETVLFLERN